MGMNYYVKNEELEVRIGKSSMGWQFLFYGYKELELNSKKDWDQFLKKNKDYIFSEDDIKVSYEELISLIKYKSSSNAKLKNHYDEVEKEGMLDTNRTIKDKEGYTMLYANFVIIYGNDLKGF